MERDPSSPARDTPLDPVLQARRDKWVHRGSERPSFAETPAPGQISVWDFPRPPRLEPEPRLVEVWDEGRRIVRSELAIRVLETASPPTVYVPPADVELKELTPMPGESICEWKGRAEYRLLTARPTLGAIAWCIPKPFEGYEEIAGWLAFYATRLRCRLGGEDVVAQPGAFYGGWITSELAGPFKGAPGSDDW